MQPAPAILLAGRIRWPPGSGRTYRRVESRLLLWCRAGTMDIVLGDGAHRLDLGGWLLTSWGDGIAYRPVGRRGGETVGIHLAPHWPVDVPLRFIVAHDPVRADAGPARDRPLPGCDGVPHGDFARHPPLELLAEYCFAWFMQAPDPARARHLGRLLVDEIARARAAEREALPPALQRALAVAEHDTVLPDVGDLCRAARVSKATLARLFTRHLGCGPAAWTTRRRLLRAAELLRESDKPVAAVATAVGYHDPAHFSRAFKRLQGLPPRTYRAQHPRPPADDRAS